MGAAKNNGSEGVWSSIAGPDSVITPGEIGLELDCVEKVEAIIAGRRIRLVIPSDAGGNALSRTGGK